MSDYRYWAFLSYSSKDAEVVKKLHRKLETYRIPRDLVGRPGRGEPIPKNLFPVFRDRDELPLSHELGSTLQDALYASRYLIVVCSPHSAGSQWVNEEIRYFKMIGRADRILALIVGGEPNATTMANPPAPECFPSALRFHLNDDGTISDRPTEPIAGDLRPGKDGWRMALLKCVAGIAGCGLAALTVREKKRARNRRLVAAAVAAVFVAGAVAWWDYTRLKVSYFANIAESFGEPRGFHSVGTGEMRQREVTYRIESSHRKVRKIAAVHSSGTLTEKFDHDSATQEMKYAEDGSLSEILFRSFKGRVTARKLLSTLKDNSRIIEYKTERDDAPMALNADALSISSGASVLTHSEITSQRASYDAKGLLREVRHLNMWRQPRADPDGIFGQRYSHEAGAPFPSTITNLGEDGSPVKNRAGIAIARFRRDAAGMPTEAGLFDNALHPVLDSEGWHAYRIERDPHGNMVRKSFHDAAMAPAVVAEGFHEMRFTRDGAGNEVSKRYFGPDGKPVVSSEGYHEERTTCNAMGMCLTQSYFDAQGTPVNTAQNWHREVKTWDAGGTQTSVAYFNKANKPCADKKCGVHRMTFEEFPDGQPMSFRSFDETGKPTHPPFAAHMVRFSRNAAAIIDSWTNFDGDGQPIRDAQLETTMRMRHDQRGNIVEYAAFDADGKPMDVSGDHRRVLQYDERGLKTQEERFNALGQPIAEAGGIHRRKWTYDRRAHLVSEEFFGPDGNPVADFMGVHRSVYQHDARGYRIQQSQFDEKGKTLRTNGISLTRFVKNHADQALETSYFDESGQAVDCDGGFHRANKVFDLRGNEVRVAYFNKEGKAVLHKGEGVHATETGFDAFNRSVSTRHFNIDGKPMNGRVGWHEFIELRDSRGNIIERCMKDVQGNPLQLGSGSYLTKSAYDDKDRRILQEYFDRQGAPMLAEDGWHRYTCEFITMENGMVNEIGRYFGIKGEPVMLTKGGYHARTKEINADGSLIITSIFDTGFHPIADKDGVHSYRSDWKGGNEVKRVFFDVERKPCNIGGYGAFAKEFDSADRCTRICYFDAGGQPATGPGGFHIQTIAHTENGRVIEYAHLDTDGKPCRDKDGYYRFRNRINEKKEVVEILYFDADGKADVDENGIHRLVLTPDNKGRTCKRMYFGTSGKAVTHKDGNCGYASEYDDQDRESRRTWLGADGKPVVIHTRVASQTMAYDPAGRENQRCFFDLSGKPTCGTYGYHCWRKTFDDAGNELSRAFFGIAGEPVNIEDGRFHIWKAQYDKAGRLLEKSLFDKDMKPALHAEGHHRFVNRYNDNGQVLSLHHYGVDGEPVLWNKSFFRKEIRYDKSGNCIYEAYFGPNEKPAAGANGAAIMEAEYDEHDRLIWLRMLDANGQALASPGFPQMRVRYHGDTPVMREREFQDFDGKPLKIQKFDEKGEPVSVEE